MLKAKESRENYRPIFLMNIYAKFLLNINRKNPIIEKKDNTS